MAFAEHAPEIFGRFWTNRLIMHGEEEAGLLVMAFFFVVCGLVALGAGVAIWMRADSAAHADGNSSGAPRFGHGVRSATFIFIGVLLLSLGAFSATHFVMRVEMQANHQKPAPALVPGPISIELRQSESPLDDIGMWPSDRLPELERDGAWGFAPLPRQFGESLQRDGSSLPEDLGFTPDPESSLPWPFMSLRPWGRPSGDLGPSYVDPRFSPEPQFSPTLPQINDQLRDRIDNKIDETVPRD
jgi:hypothetical protein